MREHRADTTRAVVLALLLHVALFALMFAGLWWTRAPTPLSAAGSPISAEFIDASDLSPAMQRTLERRPEPVPPTAEPEPVPEPEPVVEDAAPAPQPLPEPVPEDAPVEPQPAPQVQVPEPAPVDQEEVRRDAIARETAEREQEEKRRQEQIDLTERQRVQEEAEQKRRLAQQKLAELRRQQDQARREAQEAERRLERIEQSRAEQAAAQAGAASSPPPGNDGADADLSGKYIAALQAAIKREWNRPADESRRCQITITQITGGEVMRVEVSPTCPYNDLGKGNIERAVMKASPLPYAGFEKAFSRKLIINFDPNE